MDPWWPSAGGGHPNRPAPWERRPGSPWENPDERRGAEPWVPGAKPDEDARKAHEELVEAIRRAEETRRRAREAPAPKPEPEPEPAAAAPEGERRTPRSVVPTSVRAAPLVGTWWTVEVQIANGSTWWPLAGAVRENEVEALALAEAVRAGKRAVVGEALDGFALANEQ